MAPFHPSVHRPVRSFLACLFLLGLAMVIPQSTAARSDSDHANSVPLASPAATSTLAQIKRIVTSTGLPNVILIQLATGEQELLPRYSLDAGQTWQATHSFPGTTPGPNCGEPIALAPRGNPNPVDNVRILYQDCNMTDLYRTGDFGQSWSLAAHAYDIMSYLTASRADPKRLYFAALASLPFPPGGSVSWVWTSGDGGLNWQVPSSGYDPFYPSPILPQRVYRGFGEWAMSDDAGQHWTSKNFPVYDLALDAQDPNWLYGLSRGSSLRISGRSGDGGTTWTPWSNPPCQLGQLVAHPTKSHVLFLLCGPALYRSRDAGDHWMLLTAGSTSAFAPDYGVPGRILWARSDGLWASTDDGDHWQFLYAPTEPWQTFFPVLQR